MVSKVAFVLLVVMIIGCSNNEAKNIEHLDMMEPLDANAVITRDEQFCQLCQNYATQVVSFLKENETQTVIVRTLHHVCSHLYSLEQQCLLLVDKYTSIFFVEIAEVQPEQLCKKVNLCENKELVHVVKYDDPCTVCRNVVSEVLTELDDPDAQLEIIQTLLKGCNQIGNFAQQCKRLVLEYGPIILLNAEKYLEKTDICAAIHACKAHQAAAIEQEFLAAA